MLTFEFLRELERKEKNTQELQKLPDDFIHELIRYMDKKKDTEDTKLIDMAITRLFNKREEKILQMAVYASRANVKVENLLPQEKEVFDKIVELIKLLRSKILSAKQEVKVQQKRVKEEYFVVTNSLPTFVGPDMKRYKLNKGDIVNLPKPLNDLLLRKGIIRKVVVGEDTKETEKIL